VVSRRVTHHLGSGNERQVSHLRSDAHTSERHPQGSPHPHTQGGRVRTRLEGVALRRRNPLQRR
jgi:hypothetical protein